MPPTAYSTKREGDLFTLTFFLPKTQIGYARYILEAYDNLGIQSTPTHSTQTTWSVPKSRRGEAEQLLTALLSEISAEESAPHADGSLPPQKTALDPSSP